MSGPRTDWDCGSNSCRYAGRGQGGQRTNGHCRCDDKAHSRIIELEAENAKLRAKCEGMDKCWALDLDAYDSLRVVAEQAREALEQAAELLIDCGCPYAPADSAIEALNKALE